MHPKSFVYNFHVIIFLGFFIIKNFGFPCRRMVDGELFCKRTFCKKTSHQVLNNTHVKCSSFVSLRYYDIVIEFSVVYLFMQVYGVPN